MATPESKVENLQGNRYGRLIVTEFLGQTPRGVPVWRAFCDCGRVTVVRSQELKRGDTKSCGCFRSEAVAKRNRESADPWMREHSSEHSSFLAARARCVNARDKDYPRYGGAGVTFHGPWLKDFRAFVEHVGRRPKGTTLDRKDSRRGYEPGNVRWATPRQQAENRKSTVWLDLGDKKVSMADAARHFQVDPAAIKQRISKKGTLDGYNPRRTRKSKDKENSC